MSQTADYHDADLLLRIFEMRREKKLREARDFMGRRCSAASYEEFKKKYPDNSAARRHWGMVFGYWEMVCALVDRGLLNEELFQSCNNEHAFLWLKFKPVIEGFRQEWKFPEMLANMERVVSRYPGLAKMEGWMKAGAIASPRRRAKKAAAR